MEKLIYFYHLTYQVKWGRVMKKIIKIGKRLFVYFVVIYITLAALLYFFPQLFLYWPSNKTPDIGFANRNGYPAKLVEYKSSDGTNLFAWYTRPQARDTGKIVVFLHGNSGNIQMFFPKVSPFNRYGYATFMPEYRGFGGIKGKITDKNLEQDAIAAIKEVNKLGYKNEDIIVYGFSLGSHMAVYSVYTLQENGKFDALVLEVPFSRLPSVAEAVFPLYMPFDILIKDKYDNMSYIPDIKTRVFIMAAEKDKIVPAQLARKLFAQAVEPKAFKMYNGEIGHNDLYDVENFVDVRNWLERE